MPPEDKWITSFGQQGMFSPVDLLQMGIQLQDLFGQKQAYSYAQPDVSGVALGDIEQPSEPGIYPTPKKSIGSRALDVAEFLTAPVTTEGYNPIRSMRESETVLQGLGHLPGALITLGASGFGAKKLAGATGRKALGELATRTIEPISYGGKLKEMFGVLRNPSSLKSLAVLEGYHKMDAVNLGRMFAYRKAFNLKPPKESLGMFTREGKKQYSLNLRNDKSRQLGLDILSREGVQGTHPVFGHYTRSFKPTIVKGKPTFETSYKDVWDWALNKGEIASTFKDFMRAPNLYKDMGNPLSLFLQRGVASALSKPITFKGTISGKDYMNLLGLPKSLSSKGAASPRIWDTDPVAMSHRVAMYGATKTSISLTRYLERLKQTLLEGSGMAKKPSKAWWKSYDNMLEYLAKNRRFQREAAYRIGSTGDDIRIIGKKYANDMYGLPKGTKNAAGQVIR